MDERSLKIDVPTSKVAMKHHKITTITQSTVTIDEF